MENTTISRAALGRLPMYLNFLRELSTDEAPYISATTIAKELMLGEVQVRKDLAMVSGAGKPRRGYDTLELIDRIEECLGYHELTKAVLVGAGRLGRALLQYDGFKLFGVDIVAAFDCNEQIISPDSKTVIYPIRRFDEFCKANDVRLGIITVGEGSAQAVCDQMVRSGITAIWNFAPCKLDIPDGVLLQNENLALSLAHLRNQLCRHGRPEIGSNDR